MTKEVIEFSDEEDGSLSIEFCMGKGKMLAISIEPNGEICWALHWDGHREHGTHKLQKRILVGLTNEEIEDCFDESCHLKVVDPKGGIKGSVNIFEVGRAIVQLCKERNT